MMTMMMERKETKQEIERRRLWSTCMTCLRYSGTILVDISLFFFSYFCKVHDDPLKAYIGTDFVDPIGFFHVW